jgi:CheY-like chemotaxis protein
VHSDGLGKGAEFVVRLPLAAEGAIAPEMNRSSAATPADACSSSRTTSTVRTACARCSSLVEHEVAVAYNGPDGLAKARSFRPEVVLCDIGLPGMDGYEVARAFRADEALKGAFLVALSRLRAPRRSATRSRGRLRAPHRQAAQRCYTPRVCGG